jgi:hypothetical protein
MRLSPSVGCRCGLSIRWTYWVHGWLDLIGNDELDGGGFERVLWIEPNHEVKNLILEKVPKKKRPGIRRRG